MPKRKADYSFGKGNYVLSETEIGGVNTSLGKGVPWNDLQANSSPVEQVIAYGAPIIPDIFIATTPDATESVKGKLRIWGNLRGTADEVRLFPNWGGRRYAWFGVYATGAQSFPAGTIAATVGGTSAITHTTDGFFIRYTTTTTNGNSNLVSTQANIEGENPSADFYFKCALRKLTDVRFHAYVSSSTPANSDTQAATALIGLRFSSSANASNLQWVHNDSVGNVNAVNSIAYTVNTIIQVHFHVANGVYTGKLYDVAGSLLDSITFTGEIPATSTQFAQCINAFNTVGGAGSEVPFDLYVLANSYV